MPALNFGAVDVGSNAARLLIVSVDRSEKKNVLRKSVFVRVPLRLGEDVFATGEIGPEHMERLLCTMSAYKNLLCACDAKTFRVCATAAMREAKNNREIVKKIKDSVGLDLEIISGGEEARIVYESHIADRLDPAVRYLYVDVGGGSTETTLIENRKMVASQSFNIGTLRVLAGKVGETEWDKLNDWLEKTNQAAPPVEIIGSGGNINKLYRMGKPGKDDKMSVSKLGKIHSRLKKTTLEERIVELGLRPDRADVIIPAAEIFLHIAGKTGAKSLHVPTMGLADGIVHGLWQQWQAGAPR